MAYTSSNGGNFASAIPDQTQAPNIPVDMAKLANSIEKRVMGVYATTAARDAAATAMGLVEGMFAFIAADNSVWYYDGSVWQPFPTPTPVIRSGTTAPANTLGNDGDVYYQY